MKRIYLHFLVCLTALLCVHCATEEEAVPSGRLTQINRNIAFTLSDSISQPTLLPNIPAAAEWNDLSNWSFWTDLLQKQEWSAKQAGWKMYPAERYTLVLTDITGHRVYDATVILEDLQGNTLAEGKTDNTGKCVLLPNLSVKTVKSTVEYQVKVIYEEQIYYVGNVSMQHPLLYKKINTARKEYSGLDILFAIDATSMGIETEFLKQELPQMLKHIKSQAEDLNLRLGSVVYRHQSNEDVIHSFPLSTDVQKMADLLSWQQSTVGTESPETLSETLLKAVNGQRWNNKARARIVFLLFDSHSQQSTRNSNRLQQVMKTAARKGIRIIPITPSRIDVDTEFLMRSLAINTNGTYIFIPRTTSASTSANISEQTIGTYKVEYLHDLISRLILQYSHLK